MSVIREHERKGAAAPKSLPNSVWSEASRLILPV